MGLYYIRELILFHQIQIYYVVYYKWAKGWDWKFDFDWQNEEPNFPPIEINTKLVEDGIFYTFGNCPAYSFIPELMVPVTWIHISFIGQFDLKKG